MADIKDNISEHNLQVYMDVARDMFDQKQGIFTFVFRVDGKKIVDYVKLENKTYGGSNH